MVFVISESVIVASILLSYKMSYVPYVILLNPPNSLLLSDTGIHIVEVLHEEIEVLVASNFLKRLFA